MRSSQATRALYCAPLSSSSWLSFALTDTATTEIYTLSLHDALPIYPPRPACRACRGRADHRCARRRYSGGPRVASVCRRPAMRMRSDARRRSEEHTSELQSLAYLVCRLLLEKKNKILYEK